MFPQQNIPNTRTGATNIFGGIGDWIDKTDFIPGVSNKGGVRTTDNGANWGKTLYNAAPASPYFDQSKYAQPSQNEIEGTGINSIYSGSASSAVNGGAPTSDPDTAAYYQDMISQLQGQNGRLDGQLNTGLGNLQNSYNTQANRLGESKAVAERNYGTQTQQNMQGYSNSRTGIMNNTRATSNALQRLLGLNGAGNSSAALEQAPYAAGLQGSQNLNEAQQNYSTNTVRLKTSKEDADRGFKNAYQDLDTQKYQQENGLRSQIAQTRAGLLDKIAQAASSKEMAMGKSYAQAQAARSPYQQQVNTLLDQITGLGNQYANPVLRAQDVAYKQAELGDFSLGNQAQIQNQPGGSGNLDPTFINLMTQRDKERNNPLGF